ACVACDAAGDDLAPFSFYLAPLRRGDQPSFPTRRSSDLAEAEELGYGVVGLEDLALEVGDEDGVGGVLDEALGVGAGLVQLAHEIGGAHVCTPPTDQAGQPPCA